MILSCIPYTEYCILFFMNILQAVLLGVVEGITEFLPISSTGHLIIATDLLGITQTEFIKSFTVIIQLGAILAVVLLYWHELVTRKNLLLKVLTAFIPTAIVGFTLYPFIKVYLLGNIEVTLWALFIGGIALLLLEWYFQKSLRYKVKNKRSFSSNEKLDVSGQQLVAINYKQSLLIGLFQSISVIPGTSRALATIFGGMIVGLSRKQAVEFSFLLAIPTMMAATGLDLVGTSFKFSSQEWMLLLIGFITSFIVAYLVIKWFIKYVSHHSFVAFGIYRIILAILLYFILI